MPIQKFVKQRVFSVILEVIKYKINNRTYAQELDKIATVLQTKTNAHLLLFFHVKIIKKQVKTTITEP